MSFSTVYVFLIEIIGTRLNHSSFSTLISDKLENESFRRYYDRAIWIYRRIEASLEKRRRVVTIKALLGSLWLFFTTIPIRWRWIDKNNKWDLGNWKLIWINVSIGRDPISGRAKFLKRELVRVISTGKILYKDRRVRKIVRALAVVVNWERDIITPMYPCQAICIRYSKPMIRQKRWKIEETNILWGNFVSFFPFPQIAARFLKIFLYKYYPSEIQCDNPI